MSPLYKPSPRGLMKSLTAALLIIAALQSLAFGETIIKEEKCKSLAHNLSITAFSSNNNGMLYAPYKLSEDKGEEYINKTRRALQEKMLKFCESKKVGVSVEEFRDKHHEVCSSECQEQSSIFKDPLIGANKTKMNADTVCLSICNKTRGKLDMFIEGIGLGKSLSKEASADCSASVSNSGRDIIKTDDLDSVNKKVKSSSATQQ